LRIPTTLPKRTRGTLRASALAPYPVVSHCRVKSHRGVVAHSSYSQPRLKTSRIVSAVVRPSTSTPVRRTRSNTRGRLTTCSTRRSRGRSETGRLVVCSRNATSHVHVTIYYKIDQSSRNSTTFPFARATLAASERPRGDGGRDASGVAAGSGCNHSGRTVMRRRCSWYQPRQRVALTIGSFGKRTKTSAAKLRVNRTGSYLV
jgi:hypothetical protein